MTLPLAPESGNLILEAGLALNNRQGLLDHINKYLSGPLSIFAGAVQPIQSNGEQTLLLYNLPANQLNNLNEGVRVTAQGVSGSTGNLKTAKLYFGSEVVSTGQISDNGTGWVLSLEAYKTGASTQQVNGWGYHNTTLITPYSATGAETDTATIAIKLTAISSTASADITLNKFLVEFFQ